MSEAGAKLFKIGIESGSERVRYDMKKHFSNDDIEWFTDNCAKYNIKQLWLMFVGYPTETEEDFNDSLRLLEKYEKYARSGHVQVHFSLPMMLTSNSNFLRKYSKEYGLEHNNDKWSDFFWTSKKYTFNTFDVRLERWKKIITLTKDLGYFTKENKRQEQKFLELEGLERVYKDYKNGIINIENLRDLEINEETFI
jgi:radical SAM superfamily enzyme YgiQ (UPF0313 family)